MRFYAMLRSLLLLPIMSALGCGTAEHPPDVDEARVSVDLGIPAGDDGLHFESLQPGGELRLQTFGQGGTHVLLGVRTIGLGTRAFVAITLRNLETGTEVTAPAPVRPQLFICESGVCDLVPLLVMTGGLTKTGTERDGVGVEVSVNAHNVEGVEAQITREAVLSSADL